MAKRDLIVRIDADPTGFERSMKSAAASASVFERELKKIEAATAKRHKAMSDLGKVGLASGAAMAAGLALAANAAVKWESAWAGVTKTVNGSAKEMGALEDELRDLAKTLPASHGEIAAVAEAAGQLGVKRKDIAAFTKTMIDLGVSTNLSSDEAATSLAQFMNVMGTAPKDVSRLGAALVALGNDGASTEADIMDMAGRLSGVGKLIGAAESDVLALANAMSSMGIEAENGGGVMSRTLLKIYSATKQGGLAVEGFAKVAGMSGAAFTKAFGADPIRAADAFVQGLSRIEAGGGNVVQVLDDLKITGSRDLQVLLQLKGAGDLLTDSLDLGAKAWAANTALTNEANKRYETTASKLKIAKNNVNDFAIDLGNTLLPAIGKASGGISDMAGFLGSLPGPAKDALVILGTLGATVGILGGAALLTVPKIAAMKASLATLNVSAKNVDRTMKALSITMKAGAIAGAIAGVAVAVDQLINALAKQGPGVNALTESLVDFAHDGKAAGELAKIVGDDFDGLQEKIKLANRNKYAPQAFSFDIRAVQSARNELKALDSALAGLVSSGNGDAAGVFLERTGLSAKDAADAFPQYTEALHGVAVEAKTAKAPVQGLNGEIFASKEDAEAAAKALQALADIIAGFISPLGAYQKAVSDAEESNQAAAEKTADAYNAGVDKKITATQRDYEARLKAARDGGKLSDAAIQKIEDERDATVDSLGKQKKSWEDYSSAVTVSVAKYLAELEKQVTAQRNWKTNMLLLSSRVSEGTLAELEKLGPEGAPLVASLVNASDKELARLEAAFRERSDAATKAFADALIRAQPVLTYLAGTIGKKAAEKLAADLAAGKTTIDVIMKQYGIAIQNGVVVPVIPPPKPDPKALAAAKKLGQDIAAALQSGIGTLLLTPVTPGGKEQAAPEYYQPYVVTKASGGYISGPGTATSDSIPARLSDGEYVQQAKAVSHYGRAFMDDVNNLRLPAFAGGGIVSSSPVRNTYGGTSTTIGSDNRKIELTIHGRADREDIRRARDEMRDEAFALGWH